MWRADDHEAIRHSILFGSLPPDLAATLVERSSLRTVRRGEMLFLQGEPAEHVYVVLEGWVKLFRMTPQGAEAVVSVFTRGGSFGEAVAFHGGVYPVSAEGATDARLLQLRAGVVLELMRERPEVAMAIVGATFLHLHRLVRELEQLKALSGAQRLAEFLLDLAPVEDGSCTLTLPYDKSLIAGRLGMKPESLSRAFARLRACGVTVNQNRLAIADLACLRELVEEDGSRDWGRPA
jgi:CRP-like cAMP-binding protein